MTFKQLSDTIHTSTVPDYYKVILLHSEAIIREVGLKDKQTVARLLKLTPQQFSLVYQCILAHVEICEA